MSQDRLQPRIWIAPIIWLGNALGPRTHPWDSPTQISNSRTCSARRVSRSMPGSIAEARSCASPRMRPRYSAAPGWEYPGQGGLQAVLAPVGGFQGGARARKGPHGAGSLNEEVCERATMRG